MEKADVIHQSIEHGRRVLVTSDIHGHIEYLQGVLKKASFSNKDMLVIVGDVIDKGTESLRTLKYIMGLKNAIVLAGNVDISRAAMIRKIDESNASEAYRYIVFQRRWFGSSMLDEMAEACGVHIESERDILDIIGSVHERFKNELDYLLSRPIVLETERYIFVHAGLTSSDTDDILHMNKWELLKYDDFMSTKLYFDKYIVVGHWPVTLYNSKIQNEMPIIDEQKRIISIDGGCGLKKSGQLNVLVMPDIYCRTADIKMYSYDKFKVYEALDDQKGSEDSVNIRWTDCAIEEIERIGDFTYAKHVSTGRKLWIYNEYILKEHRCDDYTDCELTVTSGDRLSLIKETTRGYIVKKDGVTGWYRGRLGQCITESF